MSLKLKFIALVTIGVFAVMCGGAAYLDSLLERIFQEQARELAAHAADGQTPLAGLESHRMEVLRAVFDLCGILAVAVSAAIYLVFARQVNQRMTRLVQVVNAVAQNPAAAERSRDQSSDEVGRLAAAFDQAADSLSKAFASLENKVELRSLQLSATQGSKSAIIDGSLDGIIKADQSGRIVLFNPAAERTSAGAARISSVASWARSSNGCRPTARSPANSRAWWASGAKWSASARAAASSRSKWPGLGSTRKIRPCTSRSSAT